MFNDEQKEIIAMAMDVLGPHMAYMQEVVERIGHNLDNDQHGEVTLPDTHFVALISLIQIFTAKLYEAGALDIDELNAILDGLVAQQGVSKHVH